VKIVKELWFNAGLEGVSFMLRHPGDTYTEKRSLNGAVGKALAEMFPAGGKLTHAKGESWLFHRMLVMPEGQNGLVLLFYPAYVSGPKAEFVSMCARYRRLLGFDRVAKRRWYTVGR
jgi:hypothetical protein